MQPQELLNCTLSDLQFSRTYFPAELCSSHTSFPAWKYFVFVRRDILGAVKILNILSLRGRLNLIFKSSDGDLRAREGPKDLLHHGEMLPDMRMYFLSHIKAFLVPVVMSLEEGEPKVELKHDAP